MKYATVIDPIFLGVKRSNWRPLGLVVEQGGGGLLYLPKRKLMGVSKVRSEPKSNCEMVFPGHMHLFPHSADVRTVIALVHPE